MISKMIFIGVSVVMASSVYARASGTDLVCNVKMGDSHGILIDSNRNYSGIQFQFRDYTDDLLVEDMIEGNAYRVDREGTLSTVSISNVYLEKQVNAETSTGETRYTNGEASREPTSLVIRETTVTGTYSGTITYSIVGRADVYELDCTGTL